MLAAEQGAGQPIAHPHGDRRGPGIIIANHLEVGVERGDLEDLDRGQVHLLGQSHDLGFADGVEPVLDEMEMLDEQVSPAGPIAEQAPDFVVHVGIDHPPLGEGRSVPPSRAGVDRAARALWFAGHENTTLSRGGPLGRDAIPTLAFVDALMDAKSSG